MAEHLELEGAEQELPDKAITAAILLLGLAGALVVVAAAALVQQGLLEAELLAAMVALVLHLPFLVPA
jgi:hypothetical protein